MIKKLIFVSLMAFFVNILPFSSEIGVHSVFAQDSDGSASSGLDFLASEDEMPASFSNQASQDAQQYVADKGWSIGRNSDGRFVAIGTGDIIGNPSSPTFQMKRRNAFVAAMVNAKSQISQLYSQMVAREVSHSYGEGNPSVAEEMMSSGEKKTPEEIGILGKFEMLINSELDAQLAERGVEPGSEEAEEVVQDVLNQSKFRDKISRMASSEVGALVVSKIFEDSGNVAVVATYSSNTKKLAAAMAGKGSAPKVRKRDPSKLSISAWIQSMSIKDLYPSYGVQLTSDTNGNLVIISYGQARAKSASKMSQRNAFMAAEADADGNIRSFVGETVAFSNVKENIENNQELTMGDIESQLERVQKTAIETSAQSLKITGVSTARTWTTQDKRSNSFIAGVVRRWDISSSEAALSDASDFASVGASQGGQGVQGKTSSRSSGAASRTETFSGDSGSYSHQSMESEDF